MTLTEKSIMGYYSGISLTGEILERCGFTFTETVLCEGVTLCDYRSDRMVLFILPNQGVEVEYQPIKSSEDRCYITTVQYLHQLQSLYFGLTGEELIYTP